MADEDRQPITSEQSVKAEVPTSSVEERWNTVRHLTVEAWAKKGIDITKLPMRKDVERLIRLQDKE
jgi:hypothetical protein